MKTPVLRYFSIWTVALVAALAPAVPTSAGRLLWSLDLRAVIKSDLVVRTEPVIAGGNVFVATQKGTSAGTGQWVVCLDESSGKLLWQTKLPGWGVYNQGMAVAGGRVFAGWSMREGDKDTGCLYALSEDNGKELWRFDLEAGDGWGGAPRVKNGRVVFATSLGRAYALSEKEGKVLWRTPYLGGFSGGTPVIADLEKDGSLEVVFSCTGGATVVLSLSEGHEQWRAASAYWLVAPPVVITVENHSALVQLSEDISSWQRINLRCLDGMTGEVLWDTGDINIPKGSITFPAAGQGKLVFGSCGRDDQTRAWTSRELHAYDTTTGKPLWKKNLDSGVVTSPSLTAAGQIVVKTTGYLYSLSLKDGAEVWKETITSSPSDPPGGIGLSGDALLCASLEGTVYAFKLEEKEKSNWSLRGGELNTGSH